MTVFSPPVLIPLKNIQLASGSAITIAGVTWEQYEAVLQELGDARVVPRIAYSEGVLEIISPSPAHERHNRIITDLVKALLEAQGRDWEDFGSTTFRRAKAGGLEPDTGLYIQNADRVRNCFEATDLSVYPPPDLAIETDVTSTTTLNAYRAIGVPEVWVYAVSAGHLQIYLLEQGAYVQSVQSRVFPDLAIADRIPEWVQQALRDGTSRVLIRAHTDLSQ